MEGRLSRKGSHLRMAPLRVITMGGVGEDVDVQVAQLLSLTNLTKAKLTEYPETPQSIIHHCLMLLLCSLESSSKQ